MLFNSFEFLVFFPVVTVLYFLCPHKWRWALLLAASCGFYMAFIPVYILILALTIVVDYYAGIYIEETDDPVKKKRLLVLSILVTCFILFVFKYYNFFITNIDQVAQWLGWHAPLNVLSIILPIGLSFHTFQSLSYVIEVYRGNQKAERHFGVYSLYVMFYPQLVAGPIERPQNLLHQFHAEHHFEYRRVANGLSLMLWGYFKKCFIADNLSGPVDAVFSNPHDYWHDHFYIATALFAVQIYCDFSGYSDIALGSAKVMGFDLMVNFRRPYLATSVQQFWTRWHISLTTWFRDYIYIPMGGSRVGPIRRHFNVLTVFLISGLWHGANWTYVIWGFLNGLFITIETILDKPWKRLVPNWAFWDHWAVQAVTITLKRVKVFVLVCVAWVFFRAETVKDAFWILGGWFWDAPHWYYDFGFLRRVQQMGWGLQITLTDLYVIAAGILTLEVVDKLNSKDDFPGLVNQLSWWPRWTIYYVFCTLILLFGNFNAQQFIYFQF